MPKIGEDLGSTNTGASSFAIFCAMLAEYHAEGKFLFSDPYEVDPNLPPDDADTKFASMD